MLSQPRSVVPFLKRGSHTSGNLTSHPGMLDSCPLTRSTQQIFPEHLLGAGHCARCWGRDERGSSCTFCVPMCVLSRFSRIQLFAAPWTIACQAPLSVRILQARILKWVVMPSFRGSSQPGIKPWSPTLQADFLPSELPRKPKNTGMGSLSLLQWIFLTQELNWGLLHCRWILYQLSYRESPLGLR